LLLYYITDRTQFPGNEPERRERLLEKICEAARSGVDYIQLREKDLSGRELQLLAREARKRIRSYGSSARLLINSRTDVALGVGADGVHLRSSDISPRDVRKIWREANVAQDPVVAVSCHSEAEVIAAKQSGADFVVFGPVFEKSELAEIHVAGLQGLRSACRHDIPVLALGGVTLTNAQSCIEAGAAGIAGIRLFQKNEIEEMVKTLRDV
jgi:thiamine-phosphate pyrophosphorylase